MYTDAFGIRSFIINGVRTKKAKVKASLFQPLSLLEMVVYHRNTGDIDRISEVKAAMPFMNIPFDIRRSSVALLMTEVLYKTIREEAPHPELFNFIVQAVTTLDREEELAPDFLLIFLARLSAFLGFGISSFREPVEQLALEREFSEEEVRIVTDAVNGQEGSSTNLDAPLRRKALQCLLDFYNSHYEGFYPLQSLKIIREVFS